jgi:dienelactone hydrolase
MLKSILLTLLFSSSNLILYGQKPALDTAAFKNWPAVSWSAITNNGKYVCYTHKNSKGTQSTVIKSSQNNWTIELQGVSSVSFSQDSHHFTWLKQDTLFTGLLGSNKKEVILSVDGFRIYNKNKNGNWLVYQPKNTDALILKDTRTGQERRFTSVKNYWLSTNGSTLIWTNQGAKDARQIELNKLNLITNVRNKVWVGSKLLSPVINPTGDFAFIGKDTISIDNALWYLGNSKMDVQRVIKEPLVGSLASGAIKNIRGISDLDHRVFIDVINNEESIKMTKKTNVNIWSYNDPKLQSQQISELNISSNSVIVAVNVNDQHLINIGNETINSPIYSPVNTLDYLLLSSEGNGSTGEWNWNPASIYSFDLLSLKNGEKRPIDTLAHAGWSVYAKRVLSPKQRFIIYFNPQDRNYFSYSIADRVVRNLTKNIQANWTALEQDDVPASNQFPIGVAGFTTDDDAVLLYDQNDIFQVDLTGKTNPICITNRYGKLHHIVFRIARFFPDEKVPLKQKVGLLLTAFDEISKDNGFFKTTVSVRNDPTCLAIQPYKFGTVIKARDNDTYIVERMSGSESPNWFLTTDFMRFKPVTSIRPEQAYNWLTAELVTFKTLDGKDEQGILYKPENFDRAKKYPVIFQYYERTTEMVNNFTKPSFFGDEINIPYFVSNGYLVFTPDIHYQIGYPGRSASHTVLGAARYLSKFSWVDSTKMGLQGHSFGGFETLYLITHSHFFAAAMASCPMSDFVSAYGSIVGGGDSRQRQYELYRDRIGATPWQKPNLYSENSPVLQADQITTPLFMMSNDKDDDVPFQQGVEFFTALRRLRKKVWMIQYDGGGHGVSGENAKDYTIRVKQFFDHYLKGAPPPIWMTRGIPAKLKGINNGYELDTSGAQP